VSLDLERTAIGTECGMIGADVRSNSSERPQKNEPRRSKKPGLSIQTAMAP
jgi:hypothetical protein